MIIKWGLFFHDQGLTRKNIINKYKFKILSLIFKNYFFGDFFNLI